MARVVQLAARKFTAQRDQRERDALAELLVALYTGREPVVAAEGEEEGADGFPPQLSQEHFEQGLTQLLRELDDLSIDIPKLQVYMADLLAQLVMAGCLRLEWWLRTVVEQARCLAEEDEYYTDSGFNERLVGATLQICVKRSAAAAAGGDAAAAAAAAAGAGVEAVRTQLLQFSAPSELVALLGAVLRDGPPSFDKWAADHKIEALFFS